MIGRDSRSFTKSIRASLAGVALVLVFAIHARAATPCCQITGINAATGVVTAKVNATGQSFQFKPSSQTCWNAMRVGVAVYANFQARQISLDGRTICGTIVSPSGTQIGNAPPASAIPGTAAPSPPVPPPATAAAAPTPRKAPPSAATAPTSAPACCAITQIDAAARLAQAEVNLSKTQFAFSVPASIAVQSLSVGQPVWANFTTKQVSLNGRDVCCQIVGAAGAPEKAAVPSGNTIRQGVLTPNTKQLGVVVPSSGTRNPASTTPATLGASGGRSSTGSAASPHGADPFVLIDPSVQQTSYPVPGQQNGTLYFVNVYIGNQGTAPSNNYYSVNLSVSDASGNPVCSIGTTVTTVQSASNFTVLRLHVREPAVAAQPSAAFGRTAQLISSPVPYTLNANLRFLQTPTDPSADLNPQNDQAQATVSLPSGGQVECVVASPPQIQYFSIVPGQVPGGQRALSAIALNTPPPIVVTNDSASVSNSLDIQLNSNKPQAASAPASISMQYPALIASFEVFTTPVPSPETAAISATATTLLGSNSSTANLTVRPPQLSSFQCSPSQVASGTPIHCKLQLDGYVASSSAGAANPTLAAANAVVAQLNNFVTVNLSTDHPALVQPPAAINIFSGNDSAAVDIPTIGDAQGGPVIVSASQTGVTKSASVTLTAALIKNFGCFVGNPGPTTQGAGTCTITPWSGNQYGWSVTLTAPQSQPLWIPVTEPGRLHHAGFICWHFDAAGLYVPVGQTWGGMYCSNGVPYSYFEPVPSTEMHSILAQDPTSGTQLSTTFTVLPASITGIRFGDTFAGAQNPKVVGSVAGQTVKVWVSFNSLPAPTDWTSQNAWLDVQCSGNVQIGCPTNLPIQEQNCVNDPIDGNQCVWDTALSGSAPPYNFSFGVILGACSAAVRPSGCQATVSVSSHQALGSQTGTINITPQ